MPFERSDLPLLSFSFPLVHDDGLVTRPLEHIIFRRSDMVRRSPTSSFFVRPNDPTLLRRFAHFCRYRSLYVVKEWSELFRFYGQ